MLQGLNTVVSILLLIVLLFSIPTSFSYFIFNKLKGKNKVKRISISTFPIIITALWWFVIFPNFVIYKTSIESGLDNYGKIRATDYVYYREIKNVMPELKDLPEYTDIYYQYRYLRYLFFIKETFVLVITYDEETYTNEKEKLKEKAFLTSSVFDVMPQYEFEIKSFNFRILDDEGTDFRYPKFWGAIATSDQKSSIAYLYHADLDIDIMSMDMSEYIKKHFKYNW